jgi:antitoxin YqcF
MAQASEENRQLAAIVAKAFGYARPQVRRYFDDDETSRVDIAQAADSPWPGVTSYGTLGLSDSPLIDNGREFPARCELVGACATSYKLFPNMMATCAFKVMNQKWFVYPSCFFPDIVSVYYPASPMKHVMFHDPFPWDDALTTAELPGKTVAWLLVMPVSDAELEYARSAGAGALSDIFKREQIDFFNLERPSVL